MKLAYQRGHRWIRSRYHPLRSSIRMWKFSVHFPTITFTFIPPRGIDISRNTWGITQLAQCCNKRLSYRGEKYYTEKCTFPNSHSIYSFFEFELSTRRIIRLYTRIFVLENNNTCFFLFSLFFYLILIFPIQYVQLLIHNKIRMSWIMRISYEYSFFIFTYNKLQLPRIFSLFLLLSRSLSLTVALWYIHF